MSPDRHADQEGLRDDLAAFALDALPAEEADELRDHLETCESCRARVRWLRPAVDLLPASVEQRTPSESLRESVLTIVRDEAGAGAAAEPNREHDLASDRERDPGRSRTAWWRSLGGYALRPAGALAAVILLAGGGGVGGGYAIWGGEDEPRSELRSQYIDPEVPEPGLADVVSATLEVHGNSGTLHVQEMPKLSPDEVYEVWVDRDGVMEPASVFVLRRNGTAEAAVPGPLTGADAVLVTRERRGGSQQPTNPPLLRAGL